MPDADRAAQISARLTVRAGWHAEMMKHAPSDLAWLLEQRAALLRLLDAERTRADAAEERALSAWDNGYDEGLAEGYTDATRDQMIKRITET